MWVDSKTQLIGNKSAQKGAHCVCEMNPKHKVIENTAA